MASFQLGLARRSSLSGLVVVFCSCIAGLYVAGQLWKTTRQLYYLVSQLRRGCSQDLVASKSNST